jgi:23S rRNA (cytidine1920-2'-O)/16S rRNA (cytidine1409-2'-O)-methyltransferase
MVRKSRTLARALATSFPTLEDPHGVIIAGGVAVDGRINTNPSSVIGPGATVTLAGHTVLRGEAKLLGAAAAFDLHFRGRTALDVGASAGGFTRVLLQEGARRVYAVDAGHGQLLGSLRQDARVVNLEATNLGDLNFELIPEVIEIFTVDLSYISLTDAVPQLENVRIHQDCDLVALVKPMFELHLPQPPSDQAQLQQAVQRASAGIEEGRWSVQRWIDSPVTGAKGAVEFLIHARRRTPTTSLTSPDDR